MVPSRKNPLCFVLPEEIREEMLCVQLTTDGRFFLDPYAVAIPGKGLRAEILKGYAKLFFKLSVVHVT